MRTHKNALLTIAGRLEMVQDITEQWLKELQHLRRA
jgi:hypothetical protein